MPENAGSDSVGSWLAALSVPKRTSCVWREKGAEKGLGARSMHQQPKERVTSNSLACGGAGQRREENLVFLAGIWLPFRKELLNAFHVVPGGGAITRSLPRPNAAMKRKENEQGKASGMLKVRRIERRKRRWKWVSSCRIIGIIASEIFAYMWRREGEGAEDSAKAA